MIVAIITKYTYHLYTGSTEIIAVKAVRNEIDSPHPQLG